MPPSPFVLLDFLISTIARKAPPFQVREAIAVARYLDQLGLEQPKHRQLLRTLSHHILAIMLHRSEFAAPEKDEVIDFLEKIGRTHLAVFDISTAIDIIRSSPPPQPSPPVPMLEAGGFGRNLRRDERWLDDDLSERIGAGYWALRLANVSDARGKVADALNRAGIPRKGEIDEKWTGENVAERVKQYEDRGLIGADRDARHRWLVDKWTAVYYTNLFGSGPSQPESA